MTAHQHAENMRLYAEDAAECERPWERWEWRRDGDEWSPCGIFMAWDTSCEYRRKRRPIYIIEGREVFEGDELYHTKWEGFVEVCSRPQHRGPLNSVWCLHLGSWGWANPEHLTWTKPVAKRELWQWAFKAGSDWKCSRDYYATEKAAQTGVGFMKVMRLDHTRIEVSDE